MSYLIQYGLIRIVIFVVSLFPVSFSIWLGHRAGDFIFFWMSKRRKIALENINKAFGDTMSEENKNRIARAAFQSMSVSLLELFLVNKIKVKVDETFTLLGNEHLEKAFADGKGVVLVISHLGTWEYLSFLPYITGQNWAVVVKDIRNPYLNDYINRQRKEMKVVPIEKTNSTRTILKELKENHGVAILIDQWAGGEGLWMDFFGTDTSTTSIPARLAKKTGSALIPAACIRKPSGKYEIKIHPPVSLDAGDENWERVTTERLNELLEAQIKKNPEQWLWVHRRWKKKPKQLREV